MTSKSSMVVCILMVILTLNHLMSINSTQYQRDLVTATILLEAGGEPYEGQWAVANVINNRLRLQQPRKYKNFVDVVLAPRQFSCWNGVSWMPKFISKWFITNKISHIRDTESWYQAAKLSNVIVESGFITDATKGAIYFRRNIVKTKSEAKAIAKVSRTEGYKNGSQIGNQWFWR